MNGRYWCQITSKPSFDTDVVCGICLPDESWNAVTMYYELNIHHSVEYVFFNIAFARTSSRTMIFGDRIRDGVGLFVVQKI